MINLAKEITVSIYPSYPGSPIDNMYADGKNKTSFRKATRVNNTFGSDPVPEYTYYSPASNLYNAGSVEPPVEIEEDVRIIRLLPNPVGNESINESVTIKNFSTYTISLISWQLKDGENTTLSLSSITSLEPGQEKTILRNGASLAMANNGDKIGLYNNKGTLIDEVDYGTTTLGVKIDF